MLRRRLIRTGALAAPSLLLGRSRAFAASRTLKIGYQKAAIALVVLKGKGLLERKLRPLGFDVTWNEFPSGPPLLEALNAGAINLGFTGETPPIFAQAGGTPIVYLANAPASPHTEAILVRPDSKIEKVADLRGRKVAFNKGSNVHWFILEALRGAGLRYADIQPIYLAPADAQPAFFSGAVDAWVIWDPFYAAAQAAGARLLVDATGLVPNYQFYLGRRDFVAEGAAALDATIAALAAVEAYIPANKAKVAEEVAPLLGITPAIVSVQLNRDTYGITRTTKAVLAQQQKIADAFYALRLIPRPIAVAEDAWS
ncbi:MAG TPA: aliphatic sulfonate ABC transporter substrate-binding protein [Acetobacteraceae bacterium]|nr:aliphatic sulfonate ABC transporter substrate-binding protein [Acetobacteraceae bacterium]